MMKRATISSLVLVLLAATAAEAFISQRTAWWDIRIGELADRKTEILGGNPPAVDRNVTALIDREITRGNETLDLMKKNTSSRPRPISAGEIRAMIHQALTPLFSLRCLESIMEGSESERISSSSRAAFERKANEKLHDDTVPARALGRDEAKVLSAELVLGAIINQYDSLYNGTATAVENEVFAGHGKGDVTADINEVRERVRESAMKKCAALDFLTDRAISDAMEQSATWRNEAASVVRHHQNVTEIRKLLSGAGISVSADRAGYFARNHHSLDQVYFDRVAGRYHADFEKIRPPRKRGAALEAFRLPDFSLVTKAVDAHRRRLLQGITGREDEGYFTAAAESLRTAADRITRALERKIEACEQGECDNAHAVNQARADLDKERTLADRYAGESVDFVKWAAGSKSVSGAAVVSEYRYRSERYSSYLNFVRLLVEKSAGIAPLRSPDHHLKYAVHVKNAPGLFSTLNGAFAVDRSVLPSLTAAENASIRRHRADFSAAMTASQRDISTAHASYLARHGEINRTKFEKETRRDAGIAQFDMDQMVNTLNDYVTMYGTLGYSEKALKRYQELYRKISAGENGASRSERDDAIRAGTIIPMLADFDTAAMAREHATRSYLRKEISAMVSRIQSLANLYRQYDISTGHIMTQRESSRILDSLEKNPRVAVADWVMDEKNAAEIDRKAVQKLAQAGMMRDWRPSVSSSGEGPAGTLVEISRPQMRVTLPEGWLEERIDDYHSERGIVRLFRSRDNTSSIEIARLSPESESPLNELSLAWHRKLGSRVMKGKWGRQNETDYYWTISRERAGNVRESWAFGEGADAVIISGSSPRDRFGFFHRKLEGVIGSMTK
ncbi:MAG TPA: hypothetical protein PKY31_02245 [Spirochaetota bacterium]|nr:hypothetical protein [Spirochaetota bacterium]